MMEALQDIWFNKPVTAYRRLFYLVTPNETSFESLEEVPEYVNEAAPYFLISVVLENLIMLAKGKSLMRCNDAWNSMAHGVISTLHGLLMRGTELAAYIWFYQRFCLYELPWNSPWTWILCFLATDLGYYWVHRFGHEVNIMWAGHQTHHSSEDYNLSTALRQSALHRYLNWFFYLPMALFIPPTAFLVHIQFNLLYQFWIHTELVDKIGPLEYILNTPSHHRVHHGRNPYCIDKNYAGVLIIWDRIFGTFEPEGEKVVYGLVHPLETWDPIYGQFCQLIHIIRTARQMDGWKNKLSVIFCGPGWEPGRPRLGLREDLPEVKLPAKKYNCNLPCWGNLYIWTHFLLLLSANVVVSSIKKSVGPVNVLMYILFVLFSLTSFGALYDNKSYGRAMEFLRCFICLAAGHMFHPMEMQLTWQTVLYAMYFVSALFWGCLTLSNFQFRVYKKKVQ
ncbi:alkylglycerol monooxygenase-like [Littorina saxatilis]|uniref:Alkylglycerol monooxygenase n=1 Tax=Littorina saxatilis TaxID=31220 RepID=A0AAN9FY01_9CAEN